MSLLVLIDDPKEQYSPGQSIIGRVRCSLVNFDYIEVRVELVREECIFFDDRKCIFSTVSTDDRNSNTNRRLKDQCSEVKSTLIQSGCVDAGDHEFLFTLTLPKNLPSSYATKYGQVKFFIKAYMDMAEKPYQGEVELKIFSPIDLNNAKDLSVVPVSHCEDFVMSKWSCFLENIRMEVILEKNAFVLGEAVKVTLHLHNMASLRISAIRIKLFLVVQLKVATLNEQNLNVYHCLVSDEGGGVLPHQTKDFLFKLTIPVNAEISNLERCTYFAQKGLLEVTAALHNTSKRDLKVGIDLALGHCPLRKSRASSKIIQDSTSEAESGVIHPLTCSLPPLSEPLGFKQRPPRPLPLEPPRTLTCKDQQRKPDNASYPAPPYPTVSSPRLFSDVPPQNTTTGIVPVPQPFQYASPPYPSRNSCPYPTEDYNMNQIANSPPYPKQEYDERCLPYPSNNSCPYPVEESERSRPHSIINNIPYPKEGEKFYSVESCPYPLKTKITDPKLGGTSPSYPINSKSRQYSTEITSYPPKTDPQCPKVNSDGVQLHNKRFAYSSCDYPSKTEEGTQFSRFRHSSFESYDVSKKDVPYFVSNNSAYLKDDARSTKTSLSSGLARGNVGEDVLPLLPNSVGSKFHDNCPYPKESLPSKMPMPSSSSRVSFEEKPLLYPSLRGREEAERSLLPCSAQHSLERNPELPTKMPMPLPYVPSIEVTGSFYSKMQSNPSPPYPVANKTTVGSTAPYPTLGFAEFTPMPMPMPSSGSLIFCDFIGFAVPTGTALKDARPLPSLKTKVNSDVQPSAPMLSQIEAPPVGEINKLKELTEKKNLILNVHEDISNVNEDIATCKDILDVRKDIPDVSEDVPQLPTPPASEIEINESQNKTASPTLGEAREKQGRLKRQEAIAL